MGSSCRTCPANQLVEIWRSTNARPPVPPSGKGVQCVKVGRQVGGKGAGGSAYAVGSGSGKVWGAGRKGAGCVRAVGGVRGCGMCEGFLPTNLEATKWCTMQDGARGTERECSPARGERRSKMGSVAGVQKRQCASDRGSERVLCKRQ